MHSKCFLFATIHFIVFLKFLFYWIVHKIKILSAYKIYINTDRISNDTILLKPEINKEL